jgi:hypothetical protein
MEKSKLAKGTVYSRRCRDKKRAKGVCDICGNGPLAGKWRCQKCLDAIAASQKKYKERLLSEGKCIRCCKRPLVTSRKCQVCLDKDQSRKKRERETNRDTGVCTRCGKRPPEPGIKYCGTCRTHTNNRHASLRAKAYAGYGGFVCACCGETEPAFLSIDHIENNGSIVRKVTGQGTGGSLYRWLIKNNFPPGYQVLCMNCQWGKRCCGVCPHKKTTLEPFTWIA